jgi:asparagine synthase (glutamine-hydrolysing)
MCGIVGLLTSAAMRDEELRSAINRMSECIRYRGPDDSGAWSAPEAGVALGFRRLAIIDLSPAGHQPMASASGRFTVVFNGEVFNFVELRAELESSGIRFRGHSDTEVILAAFERWGVVDAVKRFVGMFAMGVWDAHHRELHLVRDRLGIKPLYYFHGDGIVTFASELKALIAGPRIDRTLDHVASGAFLRYLYVPAPRSIFRHVKKLLPGHILTIRDVRRSAPEPAPYWSLNEVYERARRDPVSGSDEEVVLELDALINESVRLRMRSDVPMGALLSGGVDSSTVVALMQRNAVSPTRTFSIAFPGTEHDEARHAAAVARVLGTNHTELQVGGAEALEVVPSLAEMFDEPLADPSQIPTYLVSRLARREVTVALTGDGGDELFGGYERYIQGERVIRRFTRVPAVVRQIAAAGIVRPGSTWWDRAYRAVAPVMDRARRHRLAGQKMRKLGALLTHDTEFGMYRSLLSVGWQESFGADVSEDPTLIEAFLKRYEAAPLLDRMMLTDQATYLPDDLLAKVDRASMAVSLEARVPLLDHRIVEYSWRLGAQHKIRNGRGKWALRQVLYRYVDPSLVDRPKVGFSVPIGDWLRGPLRQWGLHYLDLATRVLPVPSAVANVAWKGVQAGDDSNALRVWAMLMFASWHEKWIA